MVRSLLNAMVESHHLAILNSLVGLIEFTGLMVAAPVLFDALHTGLKMGGLWAGLPFFITAFTLGLATLVVFAFRLPPGSRAT